MVRLWVLLLLSVLRLSAQDLFAPPPLNLPGTGARFVVEPDVPCHAKPDANSPVSAGLYLEREFPVADEVEVDSATWYLAGRGWNCWVYGPSTVGEEGEPVLVAAIDRVLARKDAKLGDYVEIEAFLLQSHPGWRIDVWDKQGSDYLRYRYLELLDRAASSEDFNARYFQDPLVTYWKDSHRDLLRNAPEPNQSAVTVPPEEYWKLFEANRKEPWADDVAWHASQWGPYTDECYAACQLGWVSQREEQYWTKFPRGHHISEALESASATVSDYLAKYACADEYNSIDHADIVALRDSLSNVTDPGKQQLVKSLDEIARKCPK